MEGSDSRRRSDSRWKGAIPGFTRLAQAVAGLDRPAAARLQSPLPGSSGRALRALTRPPGAALRRASCR